MERNTGSATPLTGFGCNDEISLGGVSHSPERSFARLGGGGWGIFLKFLLFVYWSTKVFHCSALMRAL